MPSNNEHKVTKRSPNACSRCRRQKIKCSGQQPCTNCGRRSLTCIFDDRDNKILVTQGYLSDLQAKVARLEQSSGTGNASNSSAPRASSPSTANHHHDTERSEQHSSPSDGRPEPTGRFSEDGTRDSSPRRDPANPDTADLINPLSITAAPKFMSSSKGQKIYLGTSSNWSFHGQILNLVHTHIHKSPLPGSDFLFEGEAYDLPWDGSRTLPDSNTPVIPSVDYAIFLINAVKFHCAQLLHLFDEDEFNSNLHSFYASPHNATFKKSLWYIHFLLIVAFGKTLVQHKHSAARPPGADFFVHALQLLPDTNRLCREPITAIEVLCCISLYLHALDDRNAAHVTIGQAMRIGQAHGMHTDMPASELGESVVQRCRKIWWTVFVLDRQMSSLMGIPQSIRDDEITCRLPSFAGSPQRSAALNMQIKLSRIYADIARTVYGPNHRLRKKFVVSIKAVLDDLTKLAEELRKSFPLHAGEQLGGISRLSAHLHLHYLQMIVLVTRPLLFCCVKKVFDAPQEVGRLTSSPKIRHLLNISLEASQNILNILESLQDQGLLETFLPWDLDSLFVSTTVLILTRFVDVSLLSPDIHYLDKAFGFLEAMISAGNRIAAHRVVELRRLDEMLSDYVTSPSRQAVQSPVACLTAANLHQQGAIRPPPSYEMGSMLPGDGGVGLYGPFTDDSSGFGDDLTAEQILAVAESMEIEGTDWLSFAMPDQGYFGDAQGQGKESVLVPQ